MASITTANGNTTLKLEYTAASAKMANFVSDALLYKYPSGFAFPADQVEGEDTVLTEVADMTNAQKAELVEELCKDYIKEMAKAYHINNARNTAADTATTETGTRYE